MKKLVLLALSIVALGLVGCGTIAPQKLPVQEILNATLPPDFEGDFHFDHANAWVQVPALEFTGLKKVGDLWTWTGMVYHGHSAVTTTNLVITPKVQTIPTPR